MSVFRILDVNFNRAREALRVLEDTARFEFENRELTLELKEMRHTLVRALKPALPAMLRSRRTETDHTKFEDRSEREGTADTVAANFKRLQEALRSLEEFSKQEGLPAAEKMAQLRFRAYDLELRFGVRAALQRARLYVILTVERCRRDPVTVARQVVEGGVDALQLRWDELSDARALELAKHLRALTRDRALYIINDRVDIALACDADGVHLGAADLPVADARRVLGPGRIIGATTHNEREARAAVAARADYLSYGPVRASMTKPGLPPVSKSYLEFMKRQPIPFFAVGGVAVDLIPELRRAGVTRVAVGEAIIGAADPGAEVRKLKRLLLR